MGCLRFFYLHWITCLSIHRVTQAQTCSKISILLLLVCMVDPTQMCPSSIFLSELFQGIICKTVRQKMGDVETLNYWRGRVILKGASYPSSYHVYKHRFFSRYRDIVSFPFLLKKSETSRKCLFCWHELNYRTTKTSCNLLQSSNYD